MISVGKHAIKDIFMLPLELAQERNYIKLNQYEEENLTGHLLRKPHKKNS